MRTLTSKWGAGTFGAVGRLSWILGNLWGTIHESVAERKMLLTCSLTDAEDFFFGDFLVMIIGLKEEDAQANAAHLVR